MRSLEIFSGAGGLAKGLEFSGFEHSALVEFDKYACLTLSTNFGSEKVFCGDIREFNLNSIDVPVDIVAGGPPCQPFSFGGKHKAFQDKRNMFPYAIEVVEKLIPKAFIFENVKGLLRPNFADYFDYIMLRLSYPGFVIRGTINWQDHLMQLRELTKLSYPGIHYDVQFKLLNAVDYGIPQMRERVFIVGIREDVGKVWSFPESTHSENRLLWDMYVSGDYWKRHEILSSIPKPIDPIIKERIMQMKTQFGFFKPELQPWHTIRDVLCDVPDPQINHGIFDHIYKSGARSYNGHTGSNYDWPAKAIKAGDHGVPGGENMIRYPDGEVRYFTVFEAKRIQTFPDNFVIKGAWGEAMRQIGNAVPVELARIIGNRLLATLYGKN